MTDMLVQAIPDNFNSRLPTLPEAGPGTFHPPHNPAPIDNPPADECVRSLDSEGLLMALVSCETVQEATSLDRQGLLRKFTASWTAESAFKDGKSTLFPSLSVNSSA